MIVCFNYGFYLYLMSLQMGTRARDNMTGASIINSISWRAVGNYFDINIQYFSQSVFVRGFSYFFSFLYVNILWFLPSSTTVHCTSLRRRQNMTSEDVTGIFGKFHWHFFTILWHFIQKNNQLIKQEKITNGLINNENNCKLRPLT